MRFACLGSGSKGNATIIQSETSTLMVDCGFSAKEATARLSDVGLRPECLNALLVTHEHGDHIRGIATLSRRYDIPVWASRGTSHYFANEQIELNIVNVHSDFEINGLKITPVAVPHDAREPCQYIFHNSDYRMGMLTDVGSITPHIVSSYKTCDVLLLEYNHDRDMLMEGHYPHALKQRVAGDFGHLSNEQSNQLLQRILPGPLKFLLAGHLSESNNTHEKVAEQLQKVMQAHDCAFAIASQDEASHWYELDRLC